MKSIYQFLVSFLFAYCIYTGVQAQLSPTVNIQLRSNLPFAGQTCANICGYAANSKEYALVGNQTGTGIVDEAIQFTIFLHIFLKKHIISTCFLSFVFTFVRR